jgi:hypothetical protein
MSDCLIDSEANKWLAIAIGAFILAGISIYEIHAI